ncbi:MAG TPA: anti-sigma factor antagonist [Actinomycetales bacterium]|nr:anti-sigma factor antagonist [Actinomycetales bacterium]
MSSAEGTVARNLLHAPLLRLVATLPGEGSATVVRLVGELDLSNAAGVHDQLADLLEYRPTDDVVLDLSGLTFLDPSGVRVLREVRRVVAVGRRGLSMRGVRPNVEMLLRVTGDEDLLPSSA